MDHKRDRGNGAAMSASTTVSSNIDGPSGDVLDNSLNVLANRPLRRFKRYPAYRDSGVEWLGEIPAHWEVRRLKAIADVRLSNVDKKSLDGQEVVQLCNYVDVYHNEFITDALEFMKATATVDQVRRFSLQKGDVLITKDSESWTDIAVPSVVTQDLPGVLCGYHLAHIRPKPICQGPFLSRSFSAAGIRDQFQIIANGITRFGLGGDAIRSGLFALPPESDQDAIAHFLDRETGKIDVLVASKERLIELLQEKRIALIANAVTKGLNSHARMKDSGITWLGEIPENWEIAPLYARYEVSLGKMLDEKRATGNFMRPYLRNIDVQWDMVNVEALPEMDFTPGEQKRYQLRSGDLLVCEGGEIGRTAVWRSELGECFYQKAIHRLRPYDVIDVPRFLFYVMYVLVKGGVFVANGNSNTIDHLTAVRLRHYRIPCPPSSEQETIAIFLDRETLKIDALVTKTARAIDRLQELRSALISAAVTGKIDVREETA
jgi:type I restriction enzyme, S subunit